MTHVIIYQAGKGDISPRILGWMFVSPSCTVLLWCCALSSLWNAVGYNISLAKYFSSWGNDRCAVCLLSQAACKALKLDFGQSPELGMFYFWWFLILLCNIFRCLISLSFCLSVRICHAFRVVEWVWVEVWLYSYWNLECVRKNK